MSLILLKKSYFPITKDVRLNETHLLIMKIPDGRELQQVAFNYSSDIDFKDFREI